MPNGVEETNIMNQDTHNASLLCRVPSPHYGLLPCNHISIRLFPSISTWRFLHGFARRSFSSFASPGRAPGPAGRLSFRVSGKGDGIVCALHSPHFSSPGSSFSTCVCVCALLLLSPPFLLLLLPPPPPPDMSHTCKVLTAAPSSTSSVPGTYIQRLL